MKRQKVYKIPYDTMEIIMQELHSAKHWLQDNKPVVAYKYLESAENCLIRAKTQKD